MPPDDVTQRLGHPMARSRALPSTRQGVAAMALLWAVRGAVMGSMAAGAAQAEPATAGPQPGAYEVRIQVEIPNVNAWAWSTTTRICVVDAATATDLPIPVLSPNNPFAGCDATTIARSDAVLSYAIACEGREAPRAQATYALLPSGFSGRIDMVLGGKNMTMRELQLGHRLGACDPAESAAQARHARERGEGSERVQEGRE